MDINEIKTDILFKKYKVVIPKADVASALENKAQEIAKTAQIPGFRVGKVPVMVIKDRYKDNIKSELINEFVQSSVDKLVQENQFELSERPAVDAIDFKDGGDFVFEVSLQLLPKMPAIDFPKITLTKYVAQAADKDIDEALVNLQNNNKTLKSVGKGVAIETGHVALIDATGYMDGKEFPEGKVTGHNLKIGSKQFIEGFESGLIGSKAGDEITLNLKFPDDYHVQKYAGKPVSFAVTIKDVLQEELPKLDDEFAKQFNLKDLAELRERSKKAVEEQLEQFSKMVMKKELFDKLDKDIEVELPPKLLQNELSFITRNAKPEEAKKVTSSKAKRAAGEEAVVDEKASHQKLAERRIKLGLFINDLARKEGIQLSQQDLSEEIMSQVRANPNAASFLIKYYQENPQAVESLRGKALEDKVVAFMLSKVATDVKNVTAEELKAHHNKIS
jgi:trigger factor